jgi:hypothetical protein
MIDDWDEPKGDGMEFEYRKARMGPLTKGIIWRRSRRGGCYDSGIDFFDVHWEAHDHDPAAIKLHVEAPRLAVDAQLNSLKERLIRALLRSGIKEAAIARGFQWERGLRASETPVQRNKSTEAFRIVLRPDQMSERHEANIQRVDTVLGSAVAQVLNRLQAEVDIAF